jgi:hypothetical protein
MADDGKPVVWVTATAVNAATLALIPDGDLIALKDLIEAEQRRRSEKRLELVVAEEGRLVRLRRAMIRLIVPARDVPPAA